MDSFKVFHILISFLKMFKEVIFFSSSGIKFLLIIEFDPFCTVQICGITKSDFERK